MKEKNKEICEEMLEYLSEILNINLLDNELLRTSLEGFIPASIVRTAYGIEVKNPFLFRYKGNVFGNFRHMFYIRKILLRNTVNPYLQIMKYHLLPYI